MEFTQVGTVKGVVMDAAQLSKATGELEFQRLGVVTYTVTIKIQAERSITRRSGLNERKVAGLKHQEKRQPRRLAHPSPTKKPSPATKNELHQWD